MRLLLALFILSISFGFSTNSTESAGAILKKVDQNISKIKDKSADVEMIMTNLKSGSSKIKKAKLFQKGLDRKLFRYTYPKSDEGIATLTIPGAVYLYLPMFKKPKKITNLAESNAFNKSDFSLEDMNTKPYSSQYIPKLLKTNPTNYILELSPKEKESTSYSHLIITVNKKFFYIEKTEYFDKKNQKVKIATNEYKKIDNQWVVSTVSMENLKKKHSTKFLMTNIKINSGLSDDFFTVEKML